MIEKAYLVKYDRAMTELHTDRQKNNYDTGIIVMF